MRRGKNLEETCHHKIQFHSSIQFIASLIANNLFDDDETVICCSLTQSYQIKVKVKKENIMMLMSKIKLDRIKRVATVIILNGWRMKIKDRTRATRNYLTSKSSYKAEMAQA